MSCKRNARRGKPQIEIGEGEIGQFERFIVPLPISSDGTRQTFEERRRIEKIGGERSRKLLRLAIGLNRQRSLVIIAVETQMQIGERRGIGIHIGVAAQIEIAEAAMFGEGQSGELREGAQGWSR